MHDFFFKKDFLQISIFSTTFSCLTLPDMLSLLIHTVPSLFLRAGTCSLLNQQ